MRACVCVFMVVVGWFFFSISDLASIFGDVSALEVTMAEILMQILTIKLNIFNSSLSLSFKMIQNPLLTKTLSAGEGILLTGAFLQQGGSSVVNAGAVVAVC